MGVRRKHRQRVRWRNEDAAADDEVAVAVAIRGRAEVRRIRPHHQVEQLLGVHEIGVRVVAAEIGQRRAVAHRAGGRAKFALENRVRIGPGNGVHRVEGEPQSATRTPPAAPRKSKSSRISST